VSQLRRLLGIDYGTKRIGVAVSDPLRIIAQSLSVIINSPKVFDEIKKLVTEYDPEKIIVGMPLNLKGEKGVKAEEVEQFIAELEREIKIEIVRFDERFTSKIAQQTMRDMHMKKKARQTKGNVDYIAAAIILQGFLDAQR
jgi:putative Holliday junction resolvase